ncbi:hypothetical protein FVB9288_01113 [Flavobacterium sp. CECT 9288]|uniref:hypothetical protein n=1 Tax=Flavobacterium sp. CECT 9288 TaxID=2845819 RepID=UPI001E539A35|nr:hypothetical protein [Flavobacterium sp. CECT 9288]CAH0335468.1 hypothetical protein FVB9288_01113 [Flavobacterium sp. CECT 9288]
MKIKQFIKSLNNTEIGKGGTHEYYVLVSKKVPNIENIFDTSNLKPKFFNLKNGGLIDSVHITIGGEFRINGLGDFYRNNNVNAGDEILFERRDTINSTEFYIDLNIKSNIITFQKNSKGFEVLNIDRLTRKMSDMKYELKGFFNGYFQDIKIEFKESSKKRSDSPEMTDFYDIIVADKNILNEFKSNDFLVLEELPNQTTLKKVVVWQKYEFQL